MTSSAAPKYDLISQDFLADPHPTFRRMRAEDPVYWHPQFNLFCVTRYNDVQLMTRDPRFSSERPNYYGKGASPSVLDKLEYYNRFVSHWMVLADPPRHTRLRGLVAKAFTPQVVEKLRPMTQQIADEMIDAVVASGRADIVRDIAHPLPAAITAVMLGIPRKDIAQFKGWTDDVMMLLGTPVPTNETVEIGYRGVISLEGYFQQIIEERRQHPQNDILTMLVLAEEQGSVLSKSELVATCAMLLVAGHDTTSNQISNGILELLRAPEQLQKLRDNPALIEGAVEELLRYNGAAFQFMRRAREDIELGGTRISAGQLLFGFLHAANRDPSRFKDPERLDITRPDNRHVAFGSGIHFCIGAQIARIETQVALNTILARLPNLALAESHLEWIPNILVHGVRALPVTFEPVR